MKAPRSLFQEVETFSSRETYLAAAGEPFGQRAGCKTPSSGCKARLGRKQTHLENQLESRPRLSELLEDGLGPCLVAGVLEELRGGVAPGTDAAGGGGNKVGLVRVVSAEGGVQDGPVWIEGGLVADDALEAGEGTVDGSFFVLPVVSERDFYLERTGLFQEMTPPRVSGCNIARGRGHDEEGWKGRGPRKRGKPKVAS